ncbi:hypothetical protein N0V83_004203 [Neocucurbitaria cava]|uniref:Uncharacterized protein n=1 Tax=Neocucurbitaria cava TaxID=798079 RepID=A0A9W9CNW2_9PLEO|nr:hypothetical protein N0V83_004203 [Neocucurbitaria cava]
MENRAENYYDIPIELLPTPNFANRPASDISMLDGMTFMMSSSEDEDEEEEATAQSQNPDNLMEWISSHPGITERPKITITQPSEEDSNAPPRSSRSEVKMMDRPPLKRKAHSSPAGALRLPKLILPQPKRVLSEREDLPKTIDGTISQQVPLDESTSSSKSYLGTAEPRRPLPPVPGQAEHMATTQENRGNGQHSSFSGKARVQGTLRQKQMGMLNTGKAKLEAKRSPNTPNSILSTPRELYGIPECQLATHSLHSAHMQDRNSVPVTPTSPSTRSRAEVSDTQRRDEGLGHVGRDTYLLGEKRVYLSGPIRLEEQSIKPRVDSCVNEDPLDLALAAKTNRFSDMVALDGVVIFFEEFGVVDPATDETLDKYWLDDRPKNAATGIGVSRTTNITSVEETTSTSPRQVQVHRVSRFSFSSGSSSASMHPIGAAAKRQRIRLRRLLSPARAALPGSAFLRNPATWGQQQAGTS